jgi:hypothetical protein
VTSYDANGAPVETEAAIVKRYPAMVHLMTTSEGLALADAEPRSVVLGDDHDATVQRLSEQLAAAKRECEAAKEKLHDEVIACTGDYDTLADERDSLSTALAAAQKDAERYRWLRDKASEGTWRELAEVTAAGTDRAIDAARREGGGE